MSDPLNEMRERIQETAEADVPAFQRIQRIEAMCEQLMLAHDEGQAALGTLREAQAAERQGIELAILAVRDRATTSDTLITEGLSTAEEIAEAGVLTHGDLDELESEGLLEATVQELIDRGELGLDGVWAITA